MEATWLYGDSKNLMDHFHFHTCYADFPHVVIQ